MGPIWVACRGLNEEMSLTLDTPMTLSNRGVISSAEIALSCWPFSSMMRRRNSHILYLFKVKMNDLFLLLGKVGGMNHYHFTVWNIKKKKKIPSLHA